MNNELIKLPQRFFDDHSDRGLPTPSVVKSNYTHVWVQANDAALPELLNDAQFYAEEAWDMGKEYIGIGSSARATVRAIQKAMQQ